MIYQPHLSIMEQLIRRASDASGLPVRVIKGAGRERLYCHVRFAVMYCARQYGLSTPKIGLGLGGRDHTTIMSGLKRAEELLADPDFCALINEIEFKQEVLAA